MKNMINYGKQTLDHEDISSVIKALKSNYLTTGPFVKKFENEICKFFGSKYTTVVNNGTSALNILAKSLKWKKNDIIITTPITFLASASCVYHSQAKVAFVDISKNTYTIDPNQLETMLKKYKRSVKSVIAVDYAGNPCDWESLRYLSKRYKFHLINDSCHSMGSKYYNDQKYAIKYADFVTQSFHPVKAITTGEGGSILSNSKFYDEKFKILRNHSMIKNKSRHWEYKVYEAGQNYRITDFQCALGISQLKKLNQFVKIRRDIAKLYDKSLKNDERFILPLHEKNKYHSYHLYSLKVDFKKVKISKNKLIESFLKKGIKLQVHYIPLHLQPFFKKNAIFKKNELKNSESFFKQQVSLPIYPSLKKKEVRFIIKNLLSIK